MVTERAPYYYIIFLYIVSLSFFLLQNLTFVAESSTVFIPASLPLVELVAILNTTVQIMGKVTNCAVPRVLPFNTLILYRIIFNLFIRLFFVV